MYVFIYTSQIFRELKSGIGNPKCLKIMNFPPQIILYEIIFALFFLPVSTFQEFSEYYLDDKLTFMY